MNKSYKTMFKGILCVGAMAACAATAGAQIQITLGFPPPEVVATTPPVVYQGHAAYFFGGRWYYRDGNAWRYYRDEPPELRDHRMHHEPERHLYGRDHGGGFRDRGRR